MTKTWLSCAFLILLPWAAALGGDLRCFQSIEKAILSVPDKALLIEWEKTHLSSSPLSFQRAWRRLEPQVRMQWVRIEALANDPESFRNTLRRIRSDLILSLVLRRFKQEFSEAIPTASFFSAWVDGIRSQIPVLHYYSETEVEGSLPFKLMLNDDSPELIAYYRPRIYRPVQQIVESDEYEIYLNKRDLPDWYSGEAWRPEPGEWTPSRKSPLTGRERIFLQGRDLEKDVLRVMREEGQVEDEYAELASGDLLFYDQVILFENQSHTRITGKDATRHFAQWRALGRNPIPISRWKPDLVTDLFGPGELRITDAVLRYVRNLRYLNGRKIGSQIELAPLQWERSLLSASQVSSRKVGAKSGVHLRYEIGRAYGRGPKQFLRLQIAALKEIAREVLEMGKAGILLTSVDVEVHASSKKTMEYYRDSFGFVDTQDPRLPPGHWVLKQSFLSYSERLLEKRRKVFGM